MFVLGVVATFLWYLTVPAMQRKNILQNAGLTILNMAWIPVLAGYLIALSTQPDGRDLVIAVVGLTYLYDTAAFMAGTVVGGAWFRRGMAPATSPKKSWEGLLVATVVTVFISVALVTSFVVPFNERRVDTMLLGLVVVIAATLGDLAESLIKRDLDVKDMSTVLPGHGGVLDRIDSLLFVAPAAYLLLGAIDVV
jgi:phosphatidate cytidylyltransferase